MIQQWPQEPVPYPQYPPYSPYPPPAPRPARWATVTIIVVAVVTAFAVAGCGLLGWKLVADRRATPDLSGEWRTTLIRDREVHEAGRQAQDASADFILALTNVDYRDLDRQRSAVLEKSTGQFKKTYENSSAQLRQVLAENKSKAEGKVTASAIQSESVDKVVVLLFVDQSVSNVAVPDPRQDKSRVKITMEKVDGRWLASDVELI
ncbi:hypothetical protein [Mycobacteroides franklinii]|uniref:Mce protein n=1 Tax=Mycobacteroides franklinii TaxID=948102 RepID=A0A4R5PAE9_9MYCO|nr:hypothetical protein [Mycobacteroides franklinii]ORA58900.1 hypothetical protein BST24_19560 [Mycobacteroides franklinii]TDH21161.1 Mce protein [Mycobacteroides franklinii]